MVPFAGSTGLRGWLAASLRAVSLDIPLLATVVASNCGRLASPESLIYNSLLERYNQVCSLLFAFGLPLLGLLLVPVVKD